MTSESQLGHFDSSGNAKMVDIADKKETGRYAKASGRIKMDSRTLAAVRRGDAPKGEVVGVAKIAAIMAAKSTPNLIPLCHAIPLDSVQVSFSFIEGDDAAIECVAEVKTTAKTGAEMEALIAVQVGLATIYDMCKGLDKGMEIVNVVLLEKRGGRSGIWKRKD